MTDGDVVAVADPGCNGHTRICHSSPNRYTLSQQPVLQQHSNYCSEFSGESGEEEQEGSNLFVQALHGQQAGLCLLGVLLGGLGCGEGLAVQGGEVGLGPQEARHEEVKEGPQLQDIVLDGGARQDEAMLSCYSLARL